MIIRLLNLLFGYVYMEAYGDKKERFINLCRVRGISVWHIKDIEGGYGLYIYARDFRLLKEIVRKTGMRVRIKKRYGLPFFLFKYRKRKAFLLGIMTAFAIVYTMSLFVWDISVDGNYTYTKYELIKFLDENGVFHGMKKSEVDCEAVEKLVRNNYFDVTWVSVELRGTRLIVHIKENFDDISVGETGEKNDGENTPEGNGGYMIVSNKDAIISGIITRTGKPMVKEGEQVTAGTVLIDGQYDIMGDYDEYIRTEYVRADGDVYGYVTYNYSDTIDRSYTLRTYTGNETAYKKIRINDDEAELNIFGDDYEKYDKIETERQLTLAGDFYIPVYCVDVLCREYTTRTAGYSDEELKAAAEKKLSYFLQNLSKKGIQIEENNVTIVVDTDKVTATGDIKVLEKIGELKAVPENREDIKQEHE